MDEKDANAVRNSAAKDASAPNALIVTGDEDAGLDVHEFLLSTMRDKDIDEALDFVFMDFPSEAPLPNVSKDTRKCCKGCGYQAVNLSTHQSDGALVSICRECLVYDDPRSEQNVQQFVVAWFPNRSKETVSAMTKLLAVMSVAVSEEQLVERYTAPEGGPFQQSVNKLFESAKVAFSDNSALITFFAKHVERIRKEISAEFQKAVADAKSLFGSNSLEEYFRYYDLSDSEAREMMDAGVRFIPRAVSKDQTGKQQIAYFLRDLVTALNAETAGLGGTEPVMSQFPTNLESVQLHPRNAVSALNEDVRVNEMTAAVTSPIGSVNAGGAKE
jgi:hypothetical protein